MSLVATFTKAKPVHLRSKVFNSDISLKDVWKWAVAIDSDTLSYNVPELLQAPLFGTLTIQFLEE